MDEPPDDDARAPEGWDVRFRPAATAALALPLVLLIGLSAGGWYYMTQLHDRTHVAVTSFPAPGIETYIHDGVENPEVAAPRPRADPRLVAAERSVVATGLRGWRGAPR